MKKTSKRIIRIAVVVLLIAVALVGAGSANGNVCQIVGGSEYATLQDAISDAPGGSTLPETPTVIVMLDNTTESVSIGTDSTHVKNITLNLNGYVIRCGGSGSVISINEGSKLTITDTGEHAATVHYFKMSDDTTVKKAGLWKWVGASESAGDGFEVTGGCITGGDYDGGGVYIDSSSTFNMYGGSIVGNTASWGYGGGVYIDSGGTFTMNGGSITGNVADDEDCGYGGGVYIKSGGTFTMNDGSILNNTSKTSGGGVYVDGTGSAGGATPVPGKLFIYGGNIVGNDSTYDGGGVYNCGFGTITVGGTARITGNTINNGTDAGNVYLNESEKINVSTDTPLSIGASIGVTTAPTAEMPVAITGVNSADYSCRFISDNQTYYVKNDGNVVKLTTEEVKRYKVTYNGNGSTSGSDPEDSGQYASGASVTVLGNIGSLTKTGCTFEGWQIDKAGTVYNAGDNYTMGASDVIFYAKWKESTVHVTGVTLDPTSARIAVDGTVPLTATVSPSNATDKSVSWSSDNENVATVSSTGVVTGVADGTATITVKTTDGGYTATCTVTVYVPVTGVTLDKETTKIAVKKTDQLTATVLPEYATDKSVTWSSSDENVATVDENGKVTAVGNGDAIITVTTHDGGYTASCAVTVYTPSSGSSVTSFTAEKDGSDFTFKNAVVITKASLPGATYAKVTNTSGSGWYNCSLSTDGNAGVAYFQVPLDVINVKGYTVNDVSMLGCKTTYLKSEGGYAKYSAVITKGGALTIDFEEDAATTAAEKVQEVVEQKQTEDCKITISGASSLNVGEKFDLSAACTCGKVHNFNWKVNDPTVATVTELGVLNGLKAGTVTVTVTDECGHSATKVINVAAKAAEQAAAKSPFPVLGILAGLGAAAFFLRRR